MFQDKTIICKDCEEVFIFTTGEQGFYLERGLLNEPLRCPTCREQRRRERTASTRQATAVVCADCGQETTVPFVPHLNRPVYCTNCYENVRSGSPA